MITMMKVTSVARQFKKGKKIIYNANNCVDSFADFHDPTPDSKLQLYQAN